LQGQRLAVVPRKEGDRPAPEFLGWHNGNLNDRNAACGGPRNHGSNDRISR
jgi:hypothetical protein